MKCPSCNSILPTNAVFCSECGARVAGTTQQRQQVTVQHQPACLWCKSTAGFNVEEGRLDSKWGMTSHKVKMFICRSCGFVHTFGQGRSIFDFD